MQDGVRPGQGSPDRSSVNNSRVPSPVAARPTGGHSPTQPLPLKPSGDPLSGELDDSPETLNFFIEFKNEIFISKIVTNFKLIVLMTGLRKS